MRKLDKFEVDVVKLQNREYEFEYVLDDSFFEYFEDSILEKGSFNVKIVISKSSTMFTATFLIKGHAVLVCDRSTEEFEYPIDLNNQLVFKFGDEYMELSDEVIVIPRDTPSVNMAQYLYEFIGLALPMKRLHPRFQQEDEQHDNDYLVYSTDPEEEKPSEESEEKRDDNEFIDPRWIILNKLKNNN